MRIHIDLADTRTRLLLVVAVLAAGAAIGIEAARWLNASRGADQEASTGGPRRRRGKASRLLSGLSFDQLQALLRPPGGSALAARLTEELMKDASLRARWEQLAREGKGRPTNTLLAQMKGEPGFDELLRKLEKEPEVRREVAKAVAGRRGKDGGGGRILVADEDELAPEAERARGTDGSGVTPSFDEIAPPEKSSSLSLMGFGLPAPIARMPLRQRAAVTAQMVQGKRLDAACEGAGLKRECTAVKQDCAQDSECSAWLRTHFGRELDLPPGAQAPNSISNIQRWAPPPASPRRAEPTPGNPTPGETPGPGEPAPPEPGQPGNPGEPGNPQPTPTPGDEAPEPGPSPTPVDLGGSQPSPTPPAPTPSPAGPEPEQQEESPPPKKINLSCEENPDLPKCRRCIAAGTPIRTPSGVKPIETFAAGDEIASVAEETGAEVAARVARVIDHGEAATLRLRLENGAELVATGEHPLYDPDARRYRLASAFKPGDRLAVASAGSLMAARIVDVSEGPRRRVFDLSVEGTRKNFVAGGIVVHNKADPRYQMQ